MLQLRRLFDGRPLLVLAGAGALAAAALAFSGPPLGTWLGPSWSPLRAVVGVPAVLLLPGHTLTAALFPRTRALDGLNRLALAIGLSTAQLPLCALILSHSVWGLSPAALVVSITALTLVWCAVASLRVAGSPSESREALWERVNPIEWAVLAMCAALLVTCAVALLLVIPERGRSTSTEFYMLGREGRGDTFPQSTAPDRPVEVQLGVTNWEAAEVAFFVVALGQGKIVGVVPAFSVGAGATWSTPLTLTLSAHGFGERIDVLLFRTDRQAPYRQLGLILDVPPPGVPSPVRVLPTAIARP